MNKYKIRSDAWRVNDNTGFSLNIHSRWLGKGTITIHRPPCQPFKITFPGIVPGSIDIAVTSPLDVYMTQLLLGNSGYHQALIMLEVPYHLALRSLDCSPARLLIFFGIDRQDNKIGAYNLGCRAQSVKLNRECSGNTTWSKNITINWCQA